MQKNFSIFWEIVPGNMCNLRCLGCYAAENARPDKKILEKDKIKLVINHIINLGCDKIDILGGEPLMYEELPFIVQHFKKKNFKSFFGIVTNGILLDYKKACRFKNVGLDQITFSLDGVTPEVNDAHNIKITLWKKQE